jgi:hypothetical protein
VSSATESREGLGRDVTDIMGPDSS